MALEGTEEGTLVQADPHTEPREGTGPRDPGQHPVDDGAADALWERTRAEVLATVRTPLSTYRLQLNRDFRFEHARALVPYLARLGVTDLYSSPVLKAMPGSNHGYDVIEHDSLNPEIGTPEEHAALGAALREQGMGLLLDVVPNHMGIGALNPLWMDVLENGAASVFARFFDIDWAPVKPELKNKVLLPILGDQYGVVLERGELQVGFAQGAFSVHYYDHRFPVSPRQYHQILRVGVDALGKELTGDSGQPSDDFIELQSILTAIEHLPERSVEVEDKRVERNREKEVIKRRLAQLAERSGPVRAFIDKNVALFNGTPGDPRSFDRMDLLLEGCPYRLAHWRVAGEEINYRRFFDINTLAALRVEDPEVFEEAHALVFRWIREGKVTGLRIDHPDGLFDPTAYFLALQERYLVERARALFLRDHPSPEGTPAGSQRSEDQDAFARLEPRLRARFRRELEQHPDSPLRKALYVVVEKIQGGKERIPESWAVHGTVGYRFANAVTGLFVDQSNEQALTEAYERFTGRTEDFDALVYEKKKLILSVSMVSEVNGLARELNRVSEMNRRSRDFTLNALRHAIIEFIAHFPVYRTYVDGWRGELDQRDVHYIHWTIQKAKDHDPATNVSIFDFLKDILLRRYDEHTDAPQREVMLRFAMKLQQLTGPVMAKGLEDTVFYIYNRLTSLNEVGGEPERFGTSLSTFHLRNQERAEYWPGALLASSTHDTKRSEDVRARINVLSELPGEFRARIRKWARLNRKHRRQLKGRLAPSANDEWLFYQTLLGAWPMGELTPGSDPSAWREFTGRIREYMAKAIKEAKVHTSWVNPDPDYDSATAAFVDAVMDPARSRSFLEDARALKRRIERPGQLNALSQVLLKLASPGTADIYQGCELWDLSLVDPDNRRPVDYRLRQGLVDELCARSGDPAALAQEVAANLDDGRAKLWLTMRGLAVRREKGELFRRGSYLPLDLAGPRAAHAVAFAREHGDDLVLAVAPRLTVPLLEGEPGGVPAGLRGTRVLLPAHFAGRTFRDALSGTCFVPQAAGEGGEAALTLEVGALLERFPVALLVADPRAPSR